MKLISAQAIAITAATLSEFGGSMHSAEVRDFASFAEAHIKAYPTHGMFEDYCFYSAGNILTDEGIAPIQSETLSLGDDHDLAADLEYITTEVHGLGFQFCTVTHYRNGALMILYFIA